MSEHDPLEPRAADGSPIWPAPETTARQSWDATPPDQPAAPAGGVAGPGGPNRTVRNWVAAGVGAVALSAAAIIGINVAGSHGSAASANGGQQIGAPGSNAAVGSNAAGSASAPGAGRGDGGTITAISGSTFTLSGQNTSSTKVVTTDATKVYVGSAGSVSDVAVGDNVVVIGTTSGSKVAADRVIDSGTDTTASAGGPPSGQAPTGASGQAPTGASGGGPAGAGPGGPGGSGAPTAGKVTKASGDTFTVTSTDGTTTTVTTSSSTAFTVVKPATVASLKVGDSIMVQGATASDGTVTATVIRTGAVGNGPPGVANGGANTGNGPPTSS